MTDTSALFAAFRAQHPDIRPDYTIDQDWKHYTATDHATWRTLYSRLEKILPGYACNEFTDGLKRLDIGRDAIPTGRPAACAPFGRQRTDSHLPTFGPCQGE